MDRPDSLEEVLKALEESLSANTAAMPSLPQVLVRVQKAVSSDTIGARQLADVILDDPSLTASVLRLANSAYYRHTKAKIRTITSAIVLLGFETIRNLALGLSVYNMFSNLPRVRNYREVWRHSLCCAVSAQALARRFDLPVPEEAFVSGLLHDMGKLVLGQFFPERYDSVLTAIRDRGLSCSDAEAQVLGCTHLEAGRFIAKFWSFPDDIINAIGCHESEEEMSAKTPPLVRVVTVANILAHILDSKDTAESLHSVTALCRKHLNIKIDDPEDFMSRIRCQVKDIGHVLDIVFEEWRFDDETSAPDAPAPETRKRPDRLEIVLIASEKSATCDDVADFLKQTISVLFDSLDLSHLLLLFNNRETGNLEAKLSYDVDGEAIDDQLKIHMDTADDVAACAFLQQLPVLVTPDNLHRFTRIKSTNILTIMGTFNVAAVPVFLSGRTVAVLVVAHDHDHDPVSEEEMRILTAYARSFSAILSRIHGSGTGVRRRSPTSLLHRSEEE